MPTIAIHIVSFNGSKELRRCLVSIARQTYKDFSILIVDNASTDGTRDFLRAWSEPGGTVLLNTTNKGFAAGHNQCIDASFTTSRPSYVLVLNQDVVLAPTCLELLVNFMNAHPRCGACQPRLLQSDGSGDRTGIIDSAGLTHYIWGHVVDRGQGAPDWGQYAHDEQVWGVTGACGLFRSEALVHAREGQQYFDEELFLYKEDVDLSFRIAFARWQIWYVAEAIAYHGRTVGVTVGRRARPFVARCNSLANTALVALKNEPVARWPLVALFLIIYIARSLAVDPAIVIPALKKIMRCAPSALAKRRARVASATPHIL